MSEFQTLQLQRRDDGIAVLTFDRPKRLNALSAEVLSELVEAVAGLGDDDDLRALVVTGAGRAFVAGADISAMSDMSEEQALEFGQLGHKAMNAIADLDVPTLAAVNGFALGGGLELALSCDLIYLSEKAKVGLPEVGLGIIPGFGGTQRLGRRIGWQQARRLVLTGETINAEEALRLGIAVEVFGADEFLDQVIAVASTIASRGPIAVRRAKEVMRCGAELPLVEANQLEVQSFAGLWNTQDRREGMAAFLEKRSPEFKGS